MLDDLFLSYLIVILLIIWFIIMFIQLFHRCYINPMIRDLSANVYHQHEVPISASLTLELKEVIKPDINCPICLDNIEKGVCLKCDHIFHEECIKKWISTDFSANKKCPLCNVNLLR